MCVTGTEPPRGVHEGELGGHAATMLTDVLRLQFLRLQLGVAWARRRSPSLCLITPHSDSDSDSDSSNGGRLVAAVDWLTVHQDVQPLPEPLRTRRLS